MIKNKKNLILSIGIIFAGLLIVGGTYAFLINAAEVSNGNYNTMTSCLTIDYSINNDDNTKDITGTLFPSRKPSNGLMGKISMKINSECNVTGKGTLYLHINDTTSPLFANRNNLGNCENATTLETMHQYNTQSDCEAASGIWRCGTALKYAIFSSSDTEEEPIKVGYAGFHPSLLLGDTNSDGTITSADADVVSNYVTGSITNIDNTLADVDFNCSINATDESIIRSGTTKGYLDNYPMKITNDGLDYVIYTDFNVTKATPLNFYIYIWLDGYISDNNYTSLPFSGYVHAEVVQSE